MKTVKQKTLGNVTVESLLTSPEEAKRLPMIVYPASGPEDHGDEVFAGESFQKKYPCHLLRVCCPEGKCFTDPAVSKCIAELIFDLQGDSLDECRVYLAGCGKGASGVWHLVSQRPHLFAAALPVFGRGDPYAARNAKFVPIWAFDTANGQTPPSVSQKGHLTAGSRRMVMGLRTCGSTCVRYTELSTEEGSEISSAWNKVVSDPEVLTWFFSQNRRNVFEVYCIRPGIWRIDDYFTASCYLVEGTEKALLIDTGLGKGDLKGLVKTLTRLPVEGAVTHPHPDHMFHAHEFDRIYLHRKDAETLRKTPAHSLHMNFTLPDPEKIIPVEEGSRIDLGGGVVIEVAELGGHTPNSVVYIDPYHQSVFTGDAIGSGYIILMICNPEKALENVSYFRGQLEKFRKHLSGLKDYAYFGGHFIQENGCDLRRQEDYLGGTSSYYNPISSEVAADMASLCEKIMDGSITMKEILASPEHACFYKTAGMMFRFD